MRNLIAVMNDILGEAALPYPNSHNHFRLPFTPYWHLTERSCQSKWRDFWTCEYAGCPLYKAKRLECESGCTCTSSPWHHYLSILYEPWNTSISESVEIHSEHFKWERSGCWDAPVCHEVEAIKDLDASPVTWAKPSRRSRCRYFLARFTDAVVLLTLYKEHESNNCIIWWLFISVSAGRRRLLNDLLYSSLFASIRYAIA